MASLDIRATNMWHVGHQHFTDDRTVVQKVSHTLCTDTFAIQCTSSYTHLSIICSSFKSIHLFLPSGRPLFPLIHPSLCYASRYFFSHTLFFPSLCTQLIPRLPCHSVFLPTTVSCLPSNSTHTPHTHMLPPPLPPSPPRLLQLRELL